MPRKTPGLGHHARIKKAMEDFILSIHVGKKFRNLDVQQFMLKETGDSAGYSYILKTLSEDPRVARDGQRGWRRVDGPAKQARKAVQGAFDTTLDGVRLISATATALVEMLEELKKKAEAGR